MGEQRIPYLMPRALRQFAVLFNTQEYYEAHEVLEDLWVIEVAPEKDFHKGLIMAAVALCHWQKGNQKSALRVLDRAMELLAPYPEGFLGVPLEKLRADLMAVFAPLRAQVVLDCPPADTLPRIRIREEIFLACASH